MMYHGLIKDRILSAPLGTLFSLPDFEDLATYDSIRKTLSRLAEEEIIRRIVNGIYQFAPFDDPAIPYPSHKELAEKIAQANHWTIVPGTEMARFYLGLSQEEPEQKIYLSTGPNAFYAHYLAMYHGGKFLTGMTYDCALVISALLDLDRYPITAAEVWHLSQTLSIELKNNLMMDISFAPARLRPVIEIICGKFGKAGR